MLLKTNVSRIAARLAAICVLTLTAAVPALAAPTAPTGEVFSLLGRAAAAAAPAPANGPFQVVADGLNNPRGLAFDAAGALYVAEAGVGGAGPCIDGPEGPACYGESGSLTRIFAGVQQRIATGLPSLAAPDGFGAGGPHDVAPRSDGAIELVLGLGGTPATRGLFPGTAVFLGQLARVSPGFQVLHTVADLATFEVNTDPDAAGADSNPYGLAINGPRRVAADAGGNSLVEVRLNGTMAALATFPPRLTPAPPFLGLPPDAMIPMQAVPTSVAIGPDGAYYVGQLTGFPFPVGEANVYRVPAGGGTPQIFAGGFTNIIDIAFGPDGSLYVLEITANGLLSNDLTGALIRVHPGGARATVASAGLVAPGGVTVGPDGALYVTNFSIFPGAGQVVRIQP